MNSAFRQFCIIGSLCLLTQVNALAKNDASTDTDTTTSISLQKLKNSLPPLTKDKSLIETVRLVKQFNEEINNIIQHQFEKGYLTEKASISVYLNPTKSNTDFSKDQSQQIEQINTHYKNEIDKFSFLDGICKISVGFYTDGGISPLTKNKETLTLTSFKNEQQKLMARDFIVLHEHFHCQFTTIDFPIIIEGQDKDFNRNINYIMKDQVYNALRSTNYINLLNENFADVSAAIALLKEFGTTNKDLLYVLNSIETRRHESYFHYRMNEHFTHFSLSELLLPETLNKIDQITDKNSFQELALEIANRGVQQVISYRPVMAESILNSRNIYYGASFYLKQLYLYQSLAVENQKIYLGGQSDFTKTILNPWSKNVTRGFSYDLAKDIIDQQNVPSLQFFNPDGSKGQNYNKLSDATNYNTIMSSPLLDKKIIDRMNNANLYLNVLRSLLIKPVDHKNIDYLENIPLPDSMEERSGIVLNKFKKIKY